MESSSLFNSKQVLLGKITIDYPKNTSNSDPNHIQLLRIYLALENEEKYSPVRDDTRELLLRCLQREESSTQSDRQMTSIVHRHMEDRSNSGSEEISSHKHETSSTVRQVPPGHPDTLQPATPTSVALQVATSVKHTDEEADPAKHFLFSVDAQPFHPTIPPVSQTSLSSCAANDDDDTDKQLPLPFLSQDTGVSVEETLLADVHPSCKYVQGTAVSIADQSPGKPQQKSISTFYITNHDETGPGLKSSIGNEVSENPKDKGKQPDANCDTVPKEVGITLHQILKDLSAQTRNRDPEATDDHKSHATEDDAASLNTRNEYWSISSFHSRTAALEDGDKSSDEDFPPPPEEFPDFELPVHSLMKPIRKNTYHPIMQGDVNQFLESATWHADSVEESGPVWTAKNIPIQPVEIASATVRSDRQRDRFLESIERMGRNGEEAWNFVSDVGRRTRMERNPSSETFYAGYVREENPGYTEEHFIRRVTRISTQSTNPAERHLRQRQRARLSRERDTIEQENAAMSASSSSPVVTHKECIVCREDCLLEDYPQSTHMSEHDICKICTARYLDSKIMREGIINIRCPAEQCPYSLEYTDIQHLAAPRTFTRYDEVLSRQAYEEDPSFIWCTNRLCTAGQLVEGGETSTHFTCPSCHFKSCFRCKTPAHPPLTCVENMTNFHSENFADDEESGRWLKRYTKPCSCGRWIQKMEGCDHVKCPAAPVGCGDEWCWMCGAKYDDIRERGNTAHKGDCPHYA